MTGAEAALCRTLFMGVAALTEVGVVTKYLGVVMTLEATPPGVGVVMLTVRYPA
jgi:hypothetical protein